MNKREKNKKGQNNRGVNSIINFFFKAQDNQDNESDERFQFFFKNIIINYGNLT